MLVYCFPLLLLKLVAVVQSQNEKGCIARDYGHGGTVCVCNATYCDSVEPVTNFPPRQYYLYTSTKDGQRLNLSHKNFGTKLKSKGMTLTLNTNITYQRIEGFGGAFTDSAGLNVYSLSPGAQENLITSYFGERGSSYTLGRLPIGGSDFSTRPYTYDDHEHDHGLRKFALAEEDHKYKIPLIKRAQELSNGTFRLLAAPWSAPPWMKTNNDFSGFGSLDEEFYNAWSKYLLRFLEEYDEKHDIQIWLLSLQNEPIDGFVPLFPFNAMAWTPQSQRKFVSKFFGPALQRSRFNETIKLLAVDDQRMNIPWWADLLFQNGEVTPFFKAIGVHWYWNHVAPAVLLDKTHEAYPDMILLSTEACITKQLWQKQAVHLGSWANGELYAASIIEDMNHWVSGWVDWNLALDERGGPNWAENYVDAPIIVNKTGDEFYKQPMYYSLAHFSKFVPPGSHRVSLSGGVRGLLATAFLTPEDHIVIVLLNKKNTDQAVSIVGAPRGIANFIVPLKSITTFICRDKKPPLHKRMLD